MSNTTVNKVIDAAILDFHADVAREQAIWDANLTALAEQYLADFDYPTDEGKALAVVNLKAAIEKAADAWIEANCAF